MPGSDIVVAEIGNSVTLKDRYAMDKITPLEDERNDWVLVASETQAGTTYIEMKRKLDTNDSQDRPFNLGTPDDRDANMAVIFAWGSGTFFYHGGERIATRINFKQPNSPDPFTPLDQDPKVCCLIDGLSVCDSGLCLRCCAKQDTHFRQCRNRLSHLKFAQRGLFRT